MSPEQAIGAALAAVDRLRDYGMRPRRRNRDQAFGAIAMQQLRDAGYEVLTRRELEKLREESRDRMVERIRRVAPPASIDADHLARQRDWSRETFGPGARTAGVIDHIRKELAEIEADPSDLSEWVDVIILAFDGAWRAGWEPQEIINAMKRKQARNEARQWPDWRTMSEDQAIEHVRNAEHEQL